MTARSLTILQLYPDDMNIYGDWGNALTLKKRAEWHGFKVDVIDYNPGDAFPDAPDIIVGGGGQDSGQLRIQDDLMQHADRLKRLADDGTPMLMICGMYQLFGKRFITKDGHEIPGIGIFDLETHGSSRRLIGNVVEISDRFGEIIGYENHSGQTVLDTHATPLATVTKGSGNNDTDRSEGCIYRNVIGSYLHGSLLPKNPRLADFFIETAALRKYGSFEPGDIDDTYAENARHTARQRPR